MKQAKKIYEFNFSKSHIDKDSAKGIIFPLLYSSVFSLLVCGATMWGCIKQQEKIEIPNKVSSVKIQIKELLVYHGEFLKKNQDPLEVIVNVKKEGKNFASCEIKVATIMAKSWDDSIDSACREAIYNVNARVYQEEKKYLKEQGEIKKQKGLQK